MENQQETVGKPSPEKISLLGWKKQFKIMEQQIQNRHDSEIFYPKFQPQKQKIINNNSIFTQKQMLFRNTFVQETRTEFCLLKQNRYIFISNRFSPKESSISKCGLVHTSQKKNDLPLKVRGEVDKSLDSTNQKQLSLPDMTKENSRLTFHPIRARNKST